MKIRSKILIILIGMLFILNLLIQLAAWLVIQDSYIKLEEAYMARNLRRVRNALEDRLAKLDSTISDWATWTDTYNFAAGNNEDYIQENLMDSALVSLQINVVAIIPKDGNRPYAKMVDLESGEETSLPQEMSALWNADSPLMDAMADNETRRGIFLLPDLTLLVAARPILTSEGTGPAAGILIIARLLDKKELESLGAIMQLPLSLIRSDDDGISAPLKDSLRSLSTGKPETISKPNDSLIEGYTLIGGLRRDQWIFLGVRASRDISAMGRITVILFLSSILAISLAIGLAVWILLRQVVINPLSGLNRGLIAIEQSRDATYRIDIVGKDEFSHVTSAINTMLDALEKNQALLQKAHKYQALAQLAGGTAHEFNNILAVIQGSIEMAMDTPGIGAAEKDLLEKAYRAGIRGADIVSQVLQYSKTTNLAKKPESPGAMVLKALDMARPLFPAHITLIMDIPEETRPILANSLQIEQIVLNLCKNAIDAIGDGPGVVEVAVKELRDLRLEPKDWIELSVRDDGSGIKASIKEHIFDPFFTTKPVGKGTGLGLSVVQGFMEQHKGTIEVSSREGQGALFMLRFPAAEDASPNPESGLVLFVSSDPAEFRLPLLALETSGRKARVESDPEEVRKLMMGGPEAVSLVLVDQAAAGGSGVELCHSIFHSHPTLPIYLLKDPDLSLDTQAIAEAGIKDTLNKPLTVRALLEIL